MVDTAYRTAQPTVLDAWATYLTQVNEVKSARDALSEAVGRNLMVNRMGFGHGTRVVGFERFTSDVNGETLLDSSLRVLKTERYVVKPNLRTKRGKDMADQLSALDSPSLDLPGMPGFHIGGDGDGVGLRTMAPALWTDKARNTRGFSALYALWPSDAVPVDLAYWESIPLSAYYTAKEKHDA